MKRRKMDKNKRVIESCSDALFVILYFRFFFLVFCKEIICENKAILTSHLKQKDVNFRALKSLFFSQ